MKKIILTGLLILFFIPDVSAKEYRFVKKVNPEILVKELEEAGIILSGKEQIGYLNTAGEKILIVTKEDIDAEKLAEVIENHNYIPPNQLEIEKKKKEKEKKDAARANAKAKLKAIIELTDEEIEALFEE